MLARLRLGFSYLRKHKLRHGFKDTLNPLCFCSIELETITHYFLCCYFYNASRVILGMIWKIFPFPSLKISDNILLSLSLYGDDKFDGTKNRRLIFTRV